MTETSPVGLANWPKAAAPRDGDEAARVSAKQGRPLYGMEFRVVDAAGNEVPHDGVSHGNMQVRGPWVAAGYHGGDGGQPPSAGSKPGTS